MAEQLKRQDVPEALTWDLTPVFESDAAQEAAVAELEKEVDSYAALAGTLGKSSDALLAALEKLEKFDRRLSLVYVYAHLKLDQDTANGTYQSMMGKVMNVYVKFSSLTAFVTPEILAIPEETLQQFLAENEALAVYKHYFERILSEREHTLSEKEEALLAGASEVFASASDTAGKLMNADLTFPEVTDDEGNKVRLTQGLYGHLLESKNGAVRKEAFDALYSSYESVKNTLASTLSATVKKHNYFAKVRHYKSAREASLANNFVPEATYDTLISVVNDKLPLLHRYMALRKKVLNLSEMHMYDTYVAIVGDEPIKYTIEQAKDITLKALAPLGKEYVALLERAFDERWIDWLENAGKRTGAYSSGVYDSAPYILMNWQDSINHLYTLVHELGHSMHSYYTHTTQPHVYGHYPIFLAEIASTTNENLLTEYLLKTETDPRVREYVLNHYLDGVRGTIFRQTQFAEFEHFMHEQDAQGTPLTHEFLSESYAKLNAKYYAPAVEQDEAIRLEWSRIPHFYYNYYVFQYATGFSAASALAERILSGNKEYVEQYFNFLKAGTSAYPIDVMKAAGVDMTKPDYIEAALAVFERRLNEFEALVTK